MFGLEFINQALLWGSFGASIPIIIHLLNRRRFKKINWAAMEFLLDAIKKNRRKIMFENILLLLVRMLIILIIIFAVARPFFKRSELGSVVAGEKRSERILILDDSYSMDHSIKQKSCFDMAKEAATKLVERIKTDSPDDQIILIKTSKLNEPDIKEAYIDETKFATIKKKIEGWQTSDLSMDLNEVFSTLLEKYLKKGEKPINRVIYFLTDFRRIDWKLWKEEQNKVLSETLSKFNATKAKLFFIDVGHEDKENLGITSIKTEPPQIICGVKTKIKTTIKNFGERALENVKVIFKIGEYQSPPEKLKRIEPGDTAEVPFSYNFKKEGLHPVTVKIQEDNLLKDNKFYFAAKAKKGINILLVDGEYALEPEKRETFYLMRALDPPGKARSGIKPYAIGQPQLNSYVDFEKYDAMVLANLSRVPIESLKKIEQFVKNGKGICIFLGRRVDPGLYNRDLYKKGKGLLPIPLNNYKRLQTGTGLSTESVHLNLKNYNHPLLAKFKGSPLLKKFNIYVGFTFNPEKENKENVNINVVSYCGDKDETPAIVEKNFGKGKVVLFCFTCDTHWTDWPYFPSYLIFMLNLINYLLKATTEECNIKIGSTLTMKIDPAKYNTEKLITFKPLDTKNAETKRIKAIGKEGGLWIKVKDVKWAGLYTLNLPKASGAGEEIKMFNVNLISEEGTLAKIFPSEIKSKIKNFKFEYVNYIEEKENVAELIAGEKNEVWKTLMIALIFFLIVESVIAWKFSYHD